MTITQAIALAGGLMAPGSDRSITIIRSVDGEAVGIDADPGGSFRLTIRSGFADGCYESAVHRARRSKISISSFSCLCCSAFPFDIPSGTQCST